MSRVRWKGDHYNKHMCLVHPSHRSAVCVPASVGVRLCPQFAHAVASHRQDRTQKQSERSGRTCPGRQHASRETRRAEHETDTTATATCVRTRHTAYANRCAARCLARVRVVAVQPCCCSNLCKFWTHAPCDAFVCLSPSLCTRPRHLHPLQQWTCYTYVGDGGARCRHRPRESGDGNRREQHGRESDGENRFARDNAARGGNSTGADACFSSSSPSSAVSLLFHASNMRVITSWAMH